MKRSRIRKDNRGDSLILVIGCIALLSVLGVVILAKTMDNQTMKMAEEKAQESFFEADSASAELATVLEKVAQDAVEKAFKDMLVEYSYHPDKLDRKARYKEFFTAALEKELDIDTKGAGYLESLVNAAVDGGISDLTITYGDVETVTNTDPDIVNTDMIRVKDVVITYMANNTKTMITTDICIEAQIPDITSNGGVACSFADFALITDAGTGVTTYEGLQIGGNVYVGGNMTSTSSGGTGIAVQNTDKMLVRGDMKVESGAKITVKNSGTITDGYGIWANGIDINGGTLETENVNVYVSDDLTIEGTNTAITMKGADSEYLGYSGNDSALAYQKSSAITINTAKHLKLDMSELAEVYINGNSYIYDEKWQDAAIPGVTVDGVLQGESVAYKDMQAMYLVPGACLSAGHNPLLLGETVNVTTWNYDTGSGVINLQDYLKTGEPYVTRSSPLDGGATTATYVYLNFKNEAKAAEYVQAYLATAKGQAIKDRALNLNLGSLTSSIKFPVDKTYTKSGALTYDGTTASWIPVDTTNAAVLNNRTISAKARYRNLFSKLSLTSGETVAADYKMVRDGILTADAFDSITENTANVIEVQDPLDATKRYKLVMYNGDLTIDATSPYISLNGILVVNGNLTVSTTGVNITGLVLVTGSSTQGNASIAYGGATFTADETAVETLLANPDVAKYFRGHTGAATPSYSSTEAVDIKFDNWRKN